MARERAVAASEQLLDLVRNCAVLIRLDLTVDPPTVVPAAPSRQPGDTGALLFEIRAAGAGHQFATAWGDLAHPPGESTLISLDVAAQGVGIARGALDEAIAHTKKRHQFGQPLAAFQATQFKLAEMATRIRAARNLYYEAAWQADLGLLDPSLVAMAKWYAGKIAVSCADEALQMHGGYGYIDEYRVQRIYRDAKIIEIYEGTKEIEKLIVARHLLQ